MFRVRPFGSTVSMYPGVAYGASRLIQSLSGVTRTGMFSHFLV